MSRASKTVQMWGVEGLPEIEPGDDLAALIAAATVADERPLADGDVVVVTSKIVSKAEGAVIQLADVVPSQFAAEWAERWAKDARVVEIVLRESVRIVRQSGPVLITETRHGLICANSGVDQSSSGGTDRVLVLPTDSDASARAIRDGLRNLAGVDVAVIVSDTFGRAWREGQVDVAIGAAGIRPITSYIGQLDPHGHEFRVQELATADELASAAELVKGNVSRLPVAVLRGVAFEADENAGAAVLVRDPSRDLFR